jgi:hypothetical protein
MKTLNKILSNKWHLHALIILFTTLFMWAFGQSSDDWFYTTFLGNFFRCFLSVFFSACIAWIVEWVQRKFFGAHQGKDGIAASDWDVIATTVLAITGVISYYFFTEIQLIIATLLFSGGCEIYRRLNK